MRKDFGNLKLVRRLGERIVIGDPNNPLAYVSVSHIATNRVQLIVSCHEDTPVHREEVANQIRQHGSRKIP